MNDTLSKVATALGRPMRVMHLLARGDKPLLALPHGGEAARRTLQLYQPQRGLARFTAGVLCGACAFGVHRILLRKASTDLSGHSGGLLPEGTDPESIGILFGSAEHRVFRAVLSYRNGENWEVGKLAVGTAGAEMLEREAGILREIGAVTPGLPALLGLEMAEDVRLLRMPYLVGRSLAHGDIAPVLALLTSWLSDGEAIPLASFSEWPSITAGLMGLTINESILKRLADLPLRPSIRHGDLARWNLLRTKDGRLKVLDWEWGERHGLPGFDLAHYLAQDFRLVRRLPAAQVIEKTVQALESPFWSPYLELAGWTGNARELVMVYLAFKQGAGHQDNTDILRVSAAVVESNV